MGQKIFIGPIPKGLEKYYLPFYIDNDSFPVLYNFYVWRGRLRKKRGTITLDRLQRQISGQSLGSTEDVTGRLITTLPIPQTTGSIVPKSVSIVIGTTTYTDLGNGRFTQGLITLGSINYVTGAIDIQTSPSAPSTAATASYSYYPGLPGMGLRDLELVDFQYPQLLAFDTKYAYQISSSTATFYSVSYYKGTNNPVTWSGQPYQQFWSTNYECAFWATNNNPGFQFERIQTITVGNPTIITTASAHGLITGDYVWFNEVTGADANLLNKFTFQITRTGANTFTIPLDTTGKAINNVGIFVTLTATPPGSSGNGIRWYDGDMTSQTGIPTSNATGWVNFSPPLSDGPFGIADLPAKTTPYYLVGALMIVPFKDRLLFFSPWIQASDGSSAIQLIDTVIWSWNGTPYYTVNDSNASVLTPTKNGTNLGADPTAYYVNQTGKGGYLSAGIQQQITTVTSNEDVLLVGFNDRQTRFVYTGNDLFPFLFYNINVEFGASSTFSAINLDRGSLTFGVFGLAMTSQTGSQRIDLSIPDEIFRIKGENSHAVERISSARDYYREWCYFTFVPNDSSWDFPTQTFQYNYREQSWSLNYENFTTHGLYRAVKGYTWATIRFASWAEWNEPWNAATSVAQFPSVVAATPQGFVVQKGIGTGEAPTGAISGVSANGGDTQILSYDHCVEQDDYLYFQNALGTTFINNLVGQVKTIIDANNFVVDISYPGISVSIIGISNAVQAVVTATNSFLSGQRVKITGVIGMTQLNGNTYQIVSSTPSSFTLNVDSTLFTPYVSGGIATHIIDYSGLGVFTRLIQPLVQTKQFPVYWAEGRKVRVGVQKYLFDETNVGQVTVNIYLSQDPGNAWNLDPIYPSDERDNSSLIYSQVVYTCPESLNLGLTSFTESINNPAPIANTQKQVWHRLNTSLIGDTFQLGITLNDTQMRNYQIAVSEISLHAIQIDVDKGPMLC